MIAVEKFGSDFMGALSYNLKKLDHPDQSKRAELLASTFSSLSASMIKKEVDLIRTLRPSLNKHVWHTSLNFSSDERSENLTNDRLLEIGLDYMRAMGYDDNQYLIVRHHDAEHPHIHLLVNRIRFDGTVVSDSNNYRKSQSVLRRLEQQYNLIPLQPGNGRSELSPSLSNGVKDKPDNSISAELYNYWAIEPISNLSKPLHNKVPGNPDNHLTGDLDNPISVEPGNKLSQRALTKNEIEKSIRTGIPSDKALLQALLDPMIYDQKLTLPGFIEQCNRAGISLLFNRASTGRISGITYFINDFKIKGQALGNRFKWAELITHIDYEQDRDSKAVSTANSLTKAKYGDFNAAQSATDQFRPGRGAPVTVANAGNHAAQRDSERQVAAGNIPKTGGDAEQDSTVGTGHKVSKQATENMEDGNINTDRSYFDTDLYSYPGIEIADDIDDEAIHGRNRHRQKKARTNRR